MQGYKLSFEPITYPIENVNFNENQRQFLGTNSERKCCYCGKGKGEVTFKKEAHIIPAGLGNRIFYNYDECDKCNEDYFSVHENELSNYLMLDRIFIGARKRHGLPKYKPISKGNTSIERIEDSNTVSIKIDDVEGRFELIDQPEKNQMIYKINRPLPYRPADICKALTHMIWPFLTEKIKLKLNHIPAWLLGKSDIFPLHLDIAFVPGNGFSHVILECWETIEEDLKYPLMVRFTFGTKILSFYIPASLDITDSPVRNMDYFQIPEHIEELSVDGMKIDGNVRLQPDFLSYTIRYNSKSEVTKTE